MMATFRIDPSPATEGNRYVRYELEATIVLVGCGGTGGFLAEALGRLLIGKTTQVFLVDLDRVEPHNLLRQAFLCGMETSCKQPTSRNLASTCIVR